MGLIVHRVRVQTLHRRRGLLCRGGADRWTGGRRTKAGRIKNEMRENDKKVKRTKDEESRKREWPDQLELTTRRTRTHTKFAAAEEGERVDLEKEKNVLFIGAPGYLTADPETRTATPVL